MGAFARPGMETTFAQIAHEILGIDVARIKGAAWRYRPDAVLHRHLRIALAGHVRRRGVASMQRLPPRMRHIAAHMLGVFDDAVTLRRHLPGRREIGRHR